MKNQKNTNLDKYKNKGFKINAYYMENAPEGQGVKAATEEQISLIERHKKIKLSRNTDMDGDIVHIHTIELSQWRRLKKAKKAGKTTVVHVHFIPLTFDGSLKMIRLFFWLLKWHVRRFYKLADHLVVVNPVFKKDLVKFGIDSKNVTYIPNFVDNTKWKPNTKSKISATRRKFGLKPDDYVVLGVGQVQTRKGVLDFVEVAKLNPEIKFVWAGGFSFGKMTDGYKELKKIMDNPPCDNLKFIGIVNRKQMNDIYNMCDIYFMPSFNELFPMAILEAVNVGKPVLLRNVKLYEGILFKKYHKANDVKGFSKIINKIKDDKSELKVALDNAKYLKDYYSPENVYKLWSEYYEKISKKQKEV